MPVSPVYEKMPQQPRLYMKKYDQFRGVDFSTDPALVDPSRSPYALNVVSDAGGCPEKRLGWKVLQTLDAPINGIHYFVTSAGVSVTVIHARDKLYKGIDTPVLIYSLMANSRSVSFTYGGKLYILDGVNYLVYDGVTVALVTALAYIPTTLIGRAPTGGGTVLEAVNLLQPKQKYSFICAGAACEVRQVQISSVASASGNLTITLNGSATNVAIMTTDTVNGLASKIRNTAFTGWTTGGVGDTVTFTATPAGAKVGAFSFNPNATGVLGLMIQVTAGVAAASVYSLDGAVDNVAVVVYVGGVLKNITTDYTFDYATGTVTFVAGHEPPSGNGVDNVVITFSRTVADYADRIKKCTICTWFGMGNDSRVFVSGNPDYPNMDWQSGLYDPTYFPDTGYTKVGSDSSAIMGYLKQFDNLLVVKEDHEQDATIYARSAEMDSYGKPYFPLKQGVAGVGAVSKYAFGSLRDDPMFLAREGVFALAPVSASMAVTRSIYQKRYVQERSYLVKAQLIKEANLQNAIAAVWNGLYVLCVNGNCYVADGHQKTGKSGTEAYGYEWFFWDNIPAVCFLARDDSLYFGAADGRVCVFNDTSDGVYAFSDDGEPIMAIWSTKADDDGDFMRYKTMPKNGSGVMVKPYTRSSVDIYIRTDDDFGRSVKSASTGILGFGDIQFDNFTFNTLDSPMIIPIGTRVRKYKTVQIIIKNDKVDEGLGVYGILKRFTIGNYVKE